MDYPDEKFHVSSIVKFSVGFPMYILEWVAYDSLKWRYCSLVEVTLGCPGESVGLMPSIECINCKLMDLYLGTLGGFWCLCTAPL